MISCAIWNKQAQVNFFKDLQNCASRASAICGFWKNLEVHIYSKLHEKNHVITY